MAMLLECGGTNKRSVKKFLHPKSDQLQMFQIIVTTPNYSDTGPILCSQDVPHPKSLRKSTHNFLSNPDHGQNAEKERANDTQIRTITLGLPL